MVGESPSRNFEGGAPLSKRQTYRGTREVVPMLGSGSQQVEGGRAAGRGWSSPSGRAERIRSPTGSGRRRPCRAIVGQRVVGQAGESRRGACPHDGYERVGGSSSSSFVGSTKTAITDAFPSLRTTSLPPPHFRYHSSLSSLRTAHRSFLAACPRRRVRVSLAVVMPRRKWVTVREREKAGPRWDEPALSLSPKPIAKGPSGGWAHPFSSSS